MQRRSRRRVPLRGTRPTSLMSLGANPDVTDSDGMNRLDHAKYTCPEDVLAALAR